MSQVQIRNPWSGEVFSVDAANWAAGYYAGNGYALVGAAPDVPSALPSPSATTTAAPAASGPLRGTPITDNCFSSASNTAQSTTGTGRKGYTVAVDATDLRFVFANWFNQGAGGSPIEQDTSNANPITVSASVEVAGVKYRLSVNGQTQWTIAGGGWVQTDPVPVEVTAGQVIYAWVYVQPTVSWYYNGNSQFATGQGGFSAQRTDAAATVTSGSNIVTDTAVIAADFGKPVTGTGIPAGTYVGTVTAGSQFLLSSTSGSQTSVNASASGTGVVVGGDLTAPGIGVATVPEATAANMYMPSQILGRPLLPLGTATVSTPVVLLTGDSLMAGSNDYSSGYSGRNVLNAQLAGGGYTERALAGKVPYINGAVSGDRAQYFMTTGYHLFRWTWASAATTMLCNYGINDVNNGRTLAQLQADLIGIWTLASRRGLRAIQHTITPFTSSTDGWSTTGNQSIANPTKEAVRTGVNDWLRDGAPVTSAASLTPVAVGTASALRAGTAGHPLYTYFEAADIAEGTRNSGRWTTLTGRSVADGSIGNGSVNLSSATAAFTSADLGKLVAIPGAGAAGAVLVAPITNINSSTAVTIGTATSAVVSSAALTIGVAATKDGLHPSGPMATLMSAAVDLTKVI